MNAECRRFYARSGHQRSQQFRLRSRDTNLVIRDLDALRQGAQMVTAIAAVVEVYPLASLAGEALGATAAF